MTGTITTRRRGGPLAVLILVLSVWIAGRAMLWQSPFPLDSFSIPTPELLLAESSTDQEQRNELVNVTSYALATAQDNKTLLLRAAVDGRSSGILLSASQQAFCRQSHPIVAQGHQYLMAAAFGMDWPQKSSDTANPAARLRRAAQTTGFSPGSPAALARTGNRWVAEGFAFFRQGSSSTAISQGRVPVYGASQVAANLRYRLRSSSKLDPYIYVRGYRAFVPQGENEGAVGVSARPLEKVPLRFAAEVRVTDNMFGTELRPAGYAVTEVPPIALPFDLDIEAYAGAGYVGGGSDTLFVDGQVSLLREVANLEAAGAVPVRLSVGGGSWGGAQNDAHRLDVGPTIRADLTVGDVPARLSVDWRERVVGDAAPESGVAATLSTRF